MATKKLDKNSIVWQKENEYHEQGIVWYMHKRTVKETIEHIVKGSYLNIDQKMEFIKDMLNGKVMIGRGYNSDIHPSKYNDGEMFTTNQYSIRLDHDNLCIKGKTSWLGYGYWRYYIARLDPLSENIIQYVREELYKIVDKGEIEQKTYVTLYNLLNIFGADLEEYLDENVSFRSSEINFYMDLDTKEVYEENEYQKITQQVDYIINHALKYTEAITGYKVQLNKDYGCDIPKMLNNTREVTTQLFTITDGEKSITTAELLQDIIDRKIVVYSSLFDNIIQHSCDMKYNGIGFDDSVIAIDLREHEMNSEKWIRYPETFVARYDEVRYTLFLWGKAKTLYETLGNERFVKFMDSKLK